MNKPSNVVKIPATIGIDLFKKWFVFLKPFHSLTNREIDVIACFAKERYELSKAISDETLLDKVVMSDDTKRKVREECGITLPHFQVIMSKLKKNKVIVDNKINPHYIPNFKHGDTTFSVLFYYDLQT
jgi:hypothetical protein